VIALDPQTTALRSDPVSNVPDFYVIGILSGANIETVSCSAIFRNIYLSGNNGIN
jgi:hypothetical protein